MAGKYTQKLKGQKVLIIGGSSGLGYGLAEALLDHGSTVIISSSNPDKIASKVADLEKIDPASKGRISGFPCNLGVEDASDNVKQLFDQVLQQTGGNNSLDHIVYTAGDHLAVGSLADWTVKKVHQAGAVRFMGPILVAQQLSRALKAGPASSFTMTTGSVADRPMPGWGILNGFATGLQGLTRGLALDLAPIRVNCVAPGAVMTELWDDFKAKGKFDGIKQVMEKQALTGQIGEVEDVVETYLYILKDKNVTGTCVYSNSGALLR